MRTYLLLSAAGIALCASSYGCKSSTDDDPKGEAGMGSPAGASGVAGTGGKSSNEAGMDNEGGETEMGGARSADGGSAGAEVGEGGAGGNSSSEGGEGGRDDTGLSGAGGCISALHGRYLLRADGKVLTPDATTPVLKASTGLPLGDVVSVQDGNDFGCAVLANGGVECWRTNSAGNEVGQLGNGELNGTGAAYRSAPVLTAPNAPLTGAVALPKTSIDYWLGAGTFAACAVLDNGGVSCWGNLTRLTNGGTKVSSPYAQPVTTNGLDALLGVNQLAIGGTDSACAVVAVASGKELRCWGYNGTYNLGTGDTAALTYPTKVLALNDPKLVTIASTGNGNYRAATCVIDGTQVKCWGLNAAMGLCGVNTADAYVTSPTLVKLSSGTALSGIIDLQAGGDFDGYGHGPAVCALRDNKTLWCWGSGFGIAATNIGATNVTAVGYPSAAPRYLTSDGIYHIGDTTIQPKCGSLE